MRCPHCGRTVDERVRFDHIELCERRSAMQRGEMPPPAPVRVLRPTEPRALDVPSWLLANAEAQLAAGLAGAA